MTPPTTLQTPDVDAAAPEATRADKATFPAALRANAPITLLCLGVAVHLLFLLSLRFGWLNPLFNDTLHRFGPGGDFFSIYAAGVKARAGESVYTVGGHVEAVPYAYAFRYAPLVAYTLGAALTVLPAIAAYAAWLIACELALLRNIRLTLALAPDKRTGYVAAALWLLFTPYYLELFVGQFTFITASLVFWAYLGWQAQERKPPPEPPRGKAHRAARKAGGRRAEGQWAGGRWADGFWAAAVWLKMMPLLFLPVVLLRGRWKGALAAGLVLALSSVAYFSSFPQDWAVFATTNAVEAPAGHAGNLGLMAFLYHAAGERQAAYGLERAAVLLLVGSGLAWLTYQAWHSLRARAGDGESRMLRLYAGCSAAYLLAYKDVWEHHYVLLLPPLVLLALRRENPWLWLPPFLISALPGLFALYDVPSIGYNEDPQVYWRSATSLLHHGGKPLAPLWLMAGLLVQSRARPVLQTLPLRRKPLASFAALGVCGLALGGGLFWARGVIAAQQRVTRDLVWPASVFQKQQTAQTCGPAALAAVCRHFGMAATEGEVARLAGTTAAGTSMLGLQTAARAKGLAAEGLRVTPGGLSRTPMPCILFFQAGHFAVLTGVRGGLFYLADPSLGQRTMTREQLASLWHGEVLVVGPLSGGRASQSAP